jgi:DNA-binding NarL/FixJ family response regulator
MEAQMRTELETSPYDNPKSPRDAHEVNHERAAVPQSEASGSQPGVSLRALIADDARSTRRFLRATLEHSRQFDAIQEASDGDEAVDVAEAFQPDIVLLDLAMPLAYGTNALRRIRAVAPRATVIVVSSLDPGIQESTFEAGAVAFIPKGLTPLEFLDCLGAIIDRSLNRERTVGFDSIWTEPRAIVFADERVTRHLVAQVLDHCGAIVIGETHNSSTLLEFLNLFKAEIVVLGLTVKGTHNIRVVPEIRRRSPNSAIVVYSAREKWNNKPVACDVTALVLRPRIEQLVQTIEGIVKTPAVSASATEL